MRGGETIHIDIGPDMDGMRLDRLMRKLLPGMPISHLHRLVRTGGARVGGRKAAAASRLARGDRLELTLSPADAAALREMLRPGRARDEKPAGAIELPVVYQDEDLLAFDKPSGVAAHPGSSHPLESTALGSLLALTSGRPASSAFRPSLVGRLDRDTSGIQLAGLSARGLRGLEEASRAGAIRKRYLALVRRDGIPKEGRIVSPLLDSRAGRDRMKAVEPGTPGAIEAVTVFSVVGEGEGAALVEARPKTGRMHQIRAHFASRGWPLAGDARYGDRRWNAALRSRSGLDRLFLHCAEVRFRHPSTGREVSIAADPPAELLRALARLKVRK